MATKDGISKALREVTGITDVLKLTAKKDVGRIYVRDLATRKGAWITAVADADDLEDQIKKTLKVPEDRDLEWAVHAYDGFPDLGEAPGTDSLARVVELMEEHGKDAVSAAVSFQGGNVDGAAKMLDKGFREIEADSEKALTQYAEEAAEEGLLSDKLLLQYVDYAKLGRDLDINGDVTAIEHGGKTFIFNG